MGRNWLVKTDDDYTFGINDVIDKIASSNSTMESVKAGAQNAVVTLQGIKDKFAAAVVGGRIENATQADLNDLTSKGAVIATAVAALGNVITACDAYKAGMQG